MLFRSAQTNRTKAENKPESDSTGLNRAGLKTSSSLNVQYLPIRRWDYSLIPSKGPPRKSKTALWSTGGAGPNILSTATKIQNTKVQFSEEVSQTWYQMKTTESCGASDSYRLVRTPHHNGKDTDGNKLILDFDKKLVKPSTFCLSFQPHLRVNVT